MVIDDKGQVLVVQEKYMFSKKYTWKLPGGLAEPCNTGANVCLHVIFTHEHTVKSDHENCTQSLLILSFFSHTLSCSSLFSLFSLYNMLSHFSFSFFSFSLLFGIPLWPGEDIATAAIREVKEETGELSLLFMLTYALPICYIFSEISHFFT